MTVFDHFIDVFCVVRISVKITGKEERGFYFLFVKDFYNM